MLRAYCSTVIKGLFREVTYKLNADFEFYITLWFYEEDFGWKGYKGKMLEGEDNYIKVGTFSNFSCVFQNPNIFFQYKF